VYRYAATNYAIVWGNPEPTKHRGSPTASDQVIQRINLFEIEGAKVRAQKAESSHNFSFRCGRNQVVGERIQAVVWHETKISLKDGVATLEQLLALPPLRNSVGQLSTHW
jgi:hypothetical protein